MRRLLALILAAGVATGACSPAELDGFIDAYGGGTELSDPANDPDVQAAGRAAAAADEDRKAAALIDEALEDHSVYPIYEAEGLRPLDARLPFYASAIWMAVDDLDEALGHRNAGVARVEAQFPEADPEEIQRRSTEMLLDALYRTLLSYGEGTDERRRLTRYYCANLAEYAQNHQGPEAQLFFVSADSSPCT